MARSKYHEWLSKLSISKKVILVVNTVFLISLMPLVILLTLNNIDDYYKEAADRARVMGVMMHNDIQQYKVDHTAFGQGGMVLIPQQQINAILSEGNVFPEVLFVAAFDSKGRRAGLWTKDNKTYDSMVFVPSSSYERHGNTAYIKVNGATVNSGVLVIGMDLSNETSRIMRNVVIIAVGIILLMVFCVLIISFFIQRIIINPILNLRKDVMNIMQTGELEIKTDKRCDDEIGKFTDEISGLITNIKQVIIATKAANARVNKAAGMAGSLATSIADCTAEVSTSTAESTTKMKNLLDSLRQISASMEVLHQSSDKGSGIVKEINKLSQQVINNAHNMNEAVSENAFAIKQMGRSIEDTAHNVSKLNDSILETSASMQEIERSVNEVEANAQQSATLSRGVLANAGKGADAIKRTTTGIANIRRSSTSAADAINNLGDKINNIGKIVHVIEDITKQTNLLALNAAIIAAQAGEHGRSFSVVSDEIAALAQRTRVSTKEISELIEAIQEESQQAVEAMHMDMRYIDEGVTLGEEAETILLDLQDMVKSSTKMSEQIASSAVEQSAAIKEVNQSLDDIVNAVKMINVITEEQAHGSRQIIQNTETISNSNSDLLASASKQGQGGAEILMAISDINAQVRKVMDEQKRSTQETQRALNSIELIEHISISQQQAVAEKLVNNIAPIMALLDNLSRQLETFKT